MLTVMDNFPVILVIGFPVLWCSMCWLLSALGGWLSLKEHYESFQGPPPDAKWLHWKSMAARRVKFFPVSYGNVLKIAYDRDALYLSVWRLFRIGHPILKLPYNEIEVETKRTLFGKVLNICMLKNPRVQLTLYGNDKDRLIDILKE